MSESQTARLHSVIWYLSVLVALVGLASVSTGRLLTGAAFGVAGGSTLVVLSLLSTWQIHRDKFGHAVGGTLGILAVASIFFVAIVVSVDVFSLGFPTDVRVVAFATGLQAMLFILSVRSPSSSPIARWLAPVTGHITVLFGSAQALGWGPFTSRTVLLAYAVGFSLLALHAFWMRQRANERVIPPRPDTDPRRWEAVLIVAVFVAVISAAIADLVVRPGTAELAVRSGGLIPESAVAQTAAAIAAGATVVGFSTIAAPPSPPGFLDVLTGTRATVVQHALTLILLLNMLLVVVLMAAPWGFYPVLGVFLAWLAIGVSVEYASVVHARRKRPTTASPAPPLPQDPSITVVVAAYNDEAVLSESLSHNIEELAPLPFVVVPASRSTDDTVAVANEFQRQYPDRVRAVEGVGDTKAADLNDVWASIDTEFALVLDSDEIVDTEFVARGLHAFEEQPELGIAQGRKVSEAPRESPLALFGSVERQQSTWLEHRFMHDVFGAGHFAGSAALIRREVPSSVGGWSPAVLTEDIDLTVRLQLQTDWEIAYDMEMVALESTPENSRELVRQRQRWTRGWAQVAERYLGTMLRSRGVGTRRTIGMSWLLFAAVSAPLATIFPTLLVLPFLGIGGGLPLLAAVVLALYLLPARGISFGYAALRDPTIPLPTTLGNAVKIVVYGYLWIVLNWIVQIHSLYLEIGGSPGVWHVTRKQTREEMRRQASVHETTVVAGTNPFSRWYRTRIGQPTTDGEILGYWLYVLGTILGVLGVWLLFNSHSAGPARQWSIVIASASLVLLMAGPAIRLPLRRSSTLLTYLGMAISAVALVWFVVAYPAQWSTDTGHPTIIALYTVGVFVIAISAAVVPLVTKSVEPDQPTTTPDETVGAQQTPVETTPRLSSDEL
mgnify:CR=1 FL=1